MVLVYHFTFQFVEPGLGFNPERIGYVFLQTTLKAKQKMLKEDWEFPEAQRKLLEQVMKTKPNTPTSTNSKAHM